MKVSFILKCITDFKITTSLPPPAKKNPLRAQLLRHFISLIKKYGSAIEQNGKSTGFSPHPRISKPQTFGEW